MKQEQEQPLRNYSKKHRLEWLALKAIIAFIRGGSINATQKKVKILIPLLQKILGSEYKWANRHLELIYGDTISARQRQALVRLVFENVIFSHVESMQIDQFQFRDSGLKNLEAGIKLGRGAIICSIHIGSWEPGLMHLADLVAPTPAAIVYRHANNPLSEAEFIKIREPYGVEWIRRDHPRQIIKAIQQKKVVGLMSDINTREAGVTAPFLGLPAQCPPGPARLALKFGCPIIPIVSLREAPGKVHFNILPALEIPDKSGVDESDIAALTTKINSSFAPIIHEHAEQYNWLHARFRSRKNGDLWDPDLALEIMQGAKVDPTAPYPNLGDRVLKLIAERV